MKIGSLVVPYKFNERNSFYLTPILESHAEFMTSWVEWKKGEVGIVLSTPSSIDNVRVFISEGVGLCFLDEIKEIT